MSNAKRSANRKASFRTGSSGSPYHTERSGGGGGGAGEVYTGGPGSAARRKMVDTSSNPRPAASGKTPGGMKTYN